LPEVIDEIFPGSRAETRRALAASAVVRRFAPRQVILRQGDESSVALVLDGHAAARRTTDDGRQLIVRIVTRGGLAPLLPLAARPSSADIVALTPSPVAVWRADEMRSLATADPGLAVDLLDKVLLSFEGVVKRLDGLLHQDAVRRVARVLSLHAELFFAEPPVLPRSNLPILVGTSREMTGRVLRVLESRQILVRVGRDRLRLLDAAGLAATADAGTDAPRSIGRVARPGPTASGGGSAANG
jgi:CRP-like cAMP-binding protein